MTALIAIAGVVALVWGGLLFARGGLVGGCLAVLLAGSCFGHPFFNIPMSPLPLTLDRFLWALLLAQYVAWRQFGWANPKPLGKTEAVLGLLLAALLFSTITHDWHVNHSQPMSRLVFYYLMPAGMYWVARQAQLTERSTYNAYAFLGLFGVYLAITAIAETRQWWGLVFPSYIGSPTFPEFLGRGRGPLLNPAGCGMFQAICLCATLAWWPRLPHWSRPALLLVVGLMFAGIYSTLTRSAWMGGMLSLMIAVGLTLPRTWRVTLIGGAAIAGVAVLATQWDSLLSFKRDKALSATETAESAKLRPILAAIAWNMFVDRPIMGCGFGQYLEENVNYLADRSTDLPLAKARPYVQHNVWLSLLTETGLVGMLLFSLLLILWAKNAWRIWTTPTAPDWVRVQALMFLATLGAYLPNAMFQDVSIIPMVNMMLFFMAGLSQGLLTYARPAAIAAPAEVAAMTGHWQPA